ncbi:MAG TPA: hypothetical protein VMW40_08675 [Candidatus Bathyarchaeia archaeon]|nr:hypothetical protein [Candidatus Bathyarchaeia archaeon]
MKCQSLIIIATVIIVSAVAFAGCIEEGGLEPPATPTPVVNPTVTPTGAPTATPAPTVTPTTTPTPTEGDYRVTISLSKMMEDITITYLGGPASKSVKSITITKVGSVTNVPYVLCEGTCPVGKSVTFRDTGIPGLWKDEDIIVTATFKDGATLVICPPSTPTHWRGYLVTATAAQRGNDIAVTYQGGPDAESVVGITITKAGSATNVPYMLCEGTCPIGESVTFSNAATPGQWDPVIVTATFEDGAEFVIFEANIIR